MSRSSHPPRTSPPCSGDKHRCNRKRLDRLPLGERTDELLPRVQVYYTRLCALPRRTRRALVRQWRRSLSAIALLLALGQAPALAATINVDGTTCTLVDAITSANTDAPAGGCPAGNGADTIVLPLKSTQSLTAVDNITHGPTGLPLITSTVTIRGRNSTIRRESNAPAFRILAVDGSGDLTLHRTTVSGGSVYYLPGGGGVYNSGTLTLTNSTVSGNRGNYGGVLYNSGTLTLTNSTVSGNGGGAYENDGRGMSNSGTATLTHSTVSGNYGGGVFNSGTLTLTNSTVSGNVSQGDGGIINTSTLTLTNSTVSGNSVVGCGHCGGVGGISNSDTLTLSNSTVSGNSGFGGVGGVSSGGTLTLARTLISGNTGYNNFPPSDNVRVYGGTTVIANNHNLFGHDGDAGVFGFSPGLTDLVPSEGLGAILNTTLANNGGPTRTHALVVGSPAIDASPDDADCVPTDQRGVRRPQRTACDIGAFEAARQSPCDTASPTRGCTVNGVPNRVCRGTSGKDRIVGTMRNDRIFGRGGADVLIGNKDDDLLCGGDGNDTLFGNAGSDRLFGNRGNDKLKGGSGPDTLNGATGADRLNGGSGTDTCRGGSGTDTGVSCETATGIP